MSDPFRRGEILTADKLNTALAGRPLTVSGSGRLSRDAKGDVVTVDQPETIYLRLTGKTGSTPIKYSWKEVYRNSAGAWVNTDRTGTTSGDYAIELNNSDLSTTDNYVYRAERSPESGEWLFFLRRSGIVLDPCVNGICRYLPTLLDFTFPSAPSYTGPSTPPITTRTTTNIYGCNDDVQLFTTMLGFNQTGILYQKLKSQAITGSVTGIPLVAGTNYPVNNDISTAMTGFTPYTKSTTYYKNGGVCQIYSDLEVTTTIQTAESRIRVTMTIGNCGFSVQLARETSISYKTYYDGQLSPGSAYTNQEVPSDWNFQTTPYNADYSTAKPSGLWTTGSAVDTFSSPALTCFSNNEERTVSFGGYTWRFYGTQLNPNF